MNVEGIIAVVGFALAAYAILPRWRQLDLAFRFRWIDGVLVSAGITGLLYLQFFPVFAVFGWTPKLGLSRWNVTTEMAASVLIGTVTILLFLHMRMMALHPYRVPRFARLVNELIRAKEYPALFTLFDERYMMRLWQISRGQNGLSRLRRWAMKGRHGWDHDRQRPDFMEFMLMMADEMVKPEAERTPIKEISRFRDFVAPKLGRLIPKQLVKQDSAQAILAQLFTSDEVMRELVGMRPEILLPILRRGEKHYDFLDPLLRHLLRMPGSALYRQVAASQAIEKGCYYDIEPKGGLLDVLLGDATFAEQHSMWQPVAQEALAMFTELRRDPEGDPYNVSYDQRFHDEGRWDYAFFIVVHYFDIMVSRALYQGVSFHMWLSYFTSFVERIIENYKPVGPDYNAQQEFPTRYSFLLYQLFSVMRNWVQTVRELPAGHANTALTGIDAEYGEEHIPKAAMRALTMSLRRVLKSDILEPKFKHDIAEMVFHLYFDLRQHGPQKYAELLLFFLTWDGHGSHDSAYGHALAAAVEESDTYFRMIFKEFDEAVVAYNGGE